MESNRTAIAVLQSVGPVGPVGQRPTPWGCGGLPLRYGGGLGGTPPRSSPVGRSKEEGRRPGARERSWRGPEAPGVWARARRRGESQDLARAVVDATRAPRGRRLAKPRTRWRWVPSGVVPGVVVGPDRVVLGVVAGTAWPVRPRGDLRPPRPARAGRTVWDGARRAGRTVGRGAKSAGRICNGRNSLPRAARSVT